MAEFDDKRQKRAIVDEDETGDEGGGQSGHIEFHDFLPTSTTKLSASEEKQKLSEHNNKNSGLIDKQKKLRDDRKNLKEGKTAGYQYGNVQAGSAYKQHPIIGKSAEFDGADPQVNLDPNLNEVETNSEKKEELTYQYQKRFELLNQSKFVPPKPSMGG